MFFCSILVRYVWFDIGFTQFYKRDGDSTSQCDVSGIPKHKTNLIWYKKTMTLHKIRPYRLNSEKRRKWQYRYQPLSLWVTTSTLWNCASNPRESERLSHRHYLWEHLDFIYFILLPLRCKIQDNRILFYISLSCRTGGGHIVKRPWRSREGCCVFSPAGIIFHDSTILVDSSLNSGFWTLFSPAVIPTPATFSYGILGTGHFL